MGGRPRSFDKDQVLDRALELFWRDGYTNTSLCSLLEHMQISRQSLYNTFGDKRRLFLAALDLYISRMGDQMLAELEKDGAGFSTVVGFFEGLRAKAVQTCGSPQVCLITRGVMELERDDSEVRARVQSHFDRVHSAFEHALRGSLERGEIHPLDADAVARHLTATLNGLSVMRKAGVAPEALSGAVEIALSVVRTTEPVQA